MSRLLITANSPGEMAGWVRPILVAWRERHSGPVDILLLPCSFATGQEERVARSLEGVERVYRPRDFWRLLWSDGQIYQGGHLLHLGGDLMYSAFLSWRWGLSAWSYMWARPWWNSAFRGYFTKDDWGVRWLRKRRVQDSQIHLTGDLVLDAVRQNVPTEPLEKQPQISYLPGSRTHELKGLTPFFLALHRRLQEHQPGTRGVLHISPFLPETQLAELLQSDPDPKVGGVKGSLEGNILKGPDGAELQIATTDGYERLAESELAISIPGTKTAEAGYLRTPVVTLVPLNRPEHLPSHGLVGLLDFLPGGSFLKGRFMLSLKGKIGLLAHPNILAQEALLPEVVEVIGLDFLEGIIAPILADKEKLRSVSLRLRSLYPWDSNPATDLVGQILG